MKSKSLFLSAFSMLVAGAISTQAQIGIFDGNQDVDGGRLGAAGSASYDAATGTYTINGSGHDIWDEADDFHFVYKQWSGDFDIQARVSISQGTSDWTKTMIMARQSLDPASANIGTRVRGLDGQFSGQQRSVFGEGGTSTAGDLRVTGLNGALQRLVKRGNQYGIFFKLDGESEWNLIESRTTELTDPFLIGFAVTSHTVGEIATGTVSEVSITKPSAIATDLVSFQEGVSGYTGTQDAHIISWDGSQNQLSRNADGTNAGSKASDSPPGGDPQNTGGHQFFEEGDFGGGTNDSKVMLLQFDTSSISAADAGRLARAQVGIYYSHERSAGGNGNGPTNPAAGDNNPHFLNTQPILKAWDEGTGGDNNAGSNVDGVDAPDNSGAITWNSTGRELWEAIGAEGPFDVGPVESTTFFDASVPGHWVWLDVTDMARGWISGSLANNGVKISQETDNIPENPPTVYVDGAYNFVSKDNEQVSLRPQLALEFINASSVGDQWSLYR